MKNTAIKYPPICDEKPVKVNLVFFSAGRSGPNLCCVLSGQLPSICAVALHSLVDGPKNYPDFSKAKSMNGGPQYKSKERVAALHCKISANSFKIEKSFRLLRDFVCQNRGYFVAALKTLPLVFSSPLVLS
jgi:hypothetical protein